LSRKSEFYCSTGVVLRPNGTGYCYRLSDGQIHSYLSEEQCRAIFGDPVVDAVKLTGRKPKLSGAMTVTKADRERGVITVSTRR